MSPDFRNPKFFGWFAALLVGAPAAAQPSVHGEWGAPIPTCVAGTNCAGDPGDPSTRTQAIHAIYLNTGKVLCVDQQFLQTLDIVLIDPLASLPTVVLVRDEFPNSHRLFCSGHAALADGRIFFSGGGNGCGNAPSRRTLYVPDTGIGTFVAAPEEVWCREGQTCPPDEPEPTRRWYPTVLLHRK